MMVKIVGSRLMIVEFPFLEVLKISLWQPEKPWVFRDIKKENVLISEIWNDPWLSWIPFLATCFLLPFSSGGIRIVDCLGWFSLTVYLSCIKQVYPLSGKTKIIFFWKNMNNFPSPANSSGNISLCLISLVRGSGLGISFFHWVSTLLLFILWLWTNDLNFSESQFALVLSEDGDNLPYRALIRFKKICKAPSKLNLEKSNSQKQSRKMVHSGLGVGWEKCEISVKV